MSIHNIRITFSQKGFGEFPAEKFPKNIYILFKASAKPLELSTYYSHSIFIQPIIRLTHITRRNTNYTSPTLILAYVNTPFK
jgi:hypothetical protein